MYVKHMDEKIAGMQDHEVREKWEEYVEKMKTFGDLMEEIDEGCMDEKFSIVIGSIIIYSQKFVDFLEYSMLDKKSDGDILIIDEVISELRKDITEYIHIWEDILKFKFNDHTEDAVHTFNTKEEAKRYARKEYHYAKEQDLWISPYQVAQLANGKWVATLA